MRLTNVFGPRQRLRDDLQGFLPIFVRRALLGEAIRVFGDGAQQRDCLYVDDVVDCLMLAALAPDAAGEVFNIGNDERLSLRAIAHAVVGAAGSGSVEHVPWPADRDAIDIGSYFGDSSKAKRMLGWTPARRSRRDRADDRVLPWHAERVPVPTVDAGEWRRIPVVDLARRAARARTGALRRGRRACWTRAATCSGPRPRRSKPSSPRSPDAVTPSAVASGTDALRLALTALGVGRGRRGDRARLHGRPDGGRRVRGRRRTRPSSTSTPTPLPSTPRGRGAR